jgi:uncharacterized protein involved in exopolysaccharide biosynthesis
VNAGILATDRDSRAPARSAWKKTLRRARRYWPIVGGGALVAIFAAHFAPQIIHPIFVSQTVLLHRELVQSTTLLGRDAPVETQRQRGTRLRDILLARANLEPILRQHGLFPEVVLGRGVHEAIDELLKVADCRVADDTYTIKFSYRDPELALQVTKRLAESLVVESARYRLEQAQATREFLEAQRRRTERELEEKEQTLAQFLAAHPEFAQDVIGQGGQSQAGASIRAQQRKAAAIDPVIDALERQRLRLARRLQASAEPGAVLLPADELDPVANEALSRARGEFERATAALVEVRARFTDAHPDVAHAQRRLDTARSSYDAMRRHVPTTRPSPVAPPRTSDDGKNELLAGELRALDDNLSRARQKKVRPGSSSSVVDLETEWTTINRDVFEIRERYQQIQRRYFQAAIIANVEASGEAAQMVVVDPAFRPDRPLARGPRRVAAAAAALTLILFIAVALVLAQFDDRISDEDDVARLGLGKLCHGLPRRARRDA